MSWISGEIGTLERHRASRRQARLHARSLWSDATADRFEERVFSAIEQEDRRFDADLQRLDAAFEDARKLL